MAVSISTEHVKVHVALVVFLVSGYLAVNLRTTAPESPLHYPQHKYNEPCRGRGVTNYNAVTPSHVRVTASPF